MSMGSVRDGGERESGGTSSSLFQRTSDVLERSAALADEHAARLAHAGRGDESDKERHAAERAREAARLARSRARGSRNSP
jgi:hypothetical protein